MNQHLLTLLTYLLQLVATICSCTIIQANDTCICFRIPVMASRLFSTLGKIGIGLAITGSVVNTALYNGKYLL